MTVATSYFCFTSEFFWPCKPENLTDEITSFNGFIKIAWSKSADDSQKRDTADIQLIRWNDKNVNDDR